MPKTKVIIVKEMPVSIIEINKQDYISLTGMLKAKDGDFFVSDWLRNRNTVEFIGTWETVYNPNFNYGEFATIRAQAALNNYKLSVKEWIEKTNALGLKASAGRYGGTYAHKDIARETPINGVNLSPGFDNRVSNLSKVGNPHNQPPTTLTILYACFAFKYPVIFRFCNSKFY